MRRSESCGILTTSSDSQFRENHIIFINKIIVIAARMISFIWYSLTVGVAAYGGMRIYLFVIVTPPRERIFNFAE